MENKLRSKRLRLNCSQLFLLTNILNHLGGLSKGAIYHHFKSKECNKNNKTDFVFSADFTWILLLAYCQFVFDIV